MEIPDDFLTDEPTPTKPDRYGIEEAYLQAAYWRQHTIGVTLMTELFSKDPMISYALRTQIRLSTSYENNAQLADMSHRDPLTGIYNVRAFEGTIGRLGKHTSFSSEIDRLISPEGERRKDEHEKVSLPLQTHLLLVDVDDFKSVNDTHGHAVGDEVLRLIAHHMLENTRSQDVVARLGGDEFGILLPGTTAQDAYGVAERIRKGVAAVTEVEDRPVTTSVSIGIGRWDFDLSLGRNKILIDHVLYEAKEGGKNRTVATNEIAQLLGLK